MSFNRWTVVEIVFAGAAALLAFVGDNLSKPLLLYSGIALFGVAAIILGLDGMINRRMVLPSRYHRRLSETYLGIAAIAWGVLFIIWGSFFIAVSFLAYNDTGRSVFLHFVRRPGLPLLIFALTCGMTAIHALVGSVEEKQGPRWELFLNLIASRLLPGLILIGITLGAAGLGLLEIFAPATFDNLGGGFLEVLYGLQ